MLQELHFRDIQLFKGAKHALREKTATATVGWSHAVEVQPELLAYFEVQRQLGPLAHVPTSLQGFAHSHVVHESHPHALAAWLVNLTVALQRLAGEPVWQGQVVDVQEGSPTEVRLAFPWHDEFVFRKAFEWAMRLLVDWTQVYAQGHANAQPVSPRLNQEIAKWAQLGREQGLPPNALRFADAAHGLDVPLQIMDGGILMLGWGAHAQRLDSSFTGQTSQIATRMARQKIHTLRWLGQNAIPVPISSVVQSWAQAWQLAQEWGWPLVIKPLDQDQGIAVVPRIRDEASLKAAFEAAAAYSHGAALLERHIESRDYRMLVVHGKLLMTCERIPGAVIGDGRHSVKQLLDQLNTDPRRQSDKRGIMIKIEANQEAEDCLHEVGLTWNAIPLAGTWVRLRKTANISTGGTALDVSDRVHPDNRLIAERAARLVGLDIAGVDFLCLDINQSWTKVGGVVCEVNAQPGFRPHWLGNPQRDINAEVVQSLFAKYPARIPVAAIGGTNGKTTTSYLLHAMWQAAGCTTGLTTTSGLWIGQDCVNQDNLSGLPGAQIVLNDPAVQAAVLEIPRKGQLIYGHPCDRYDVAVLLNVQDDHIGELGIDSLSAMAELKAEILQRAQHAVVLNADDEGVMAVRHQSLAPRQILFSLQAHNPVLQQHVAQGGEAFWLTEDAGTRYLVYGCGAHQERWMPEAEIAIADRGRIRHQLINALAAAALAFAQGLKPEVIQRVLSHFVSTAQTNPGRFNWIDGYPYSVLLDFAHNPDGVKVLCEGIRAHPAKRKIAVVLNVGNRSRLHIDAAAPLLQAHFSHLVIGHDPGRVMKCRDYQAAANPRQAMLDYFAKQLRATGLPATAIECEQDPSRAIQLGLAAAHADDLLVIIAEPELALPLLAGNRTQERVHTE